MQMMNFVPVHHYPHSKLDDQLRWTSINHQVVAFSVSDEGTVATVGGQPATLPPEVEKIKNLNVLYMLARTQLIQTSTDTTGCRRVNFLGMDYVRQHRPYPKGQIDVTKIPHLGGPSLAQVECAADACAALACGAQGCAADAGGASACGALGCAADACAAMACGALGCAGDACGGLACPALGCAADACGGLACGAQAGAGTACGAQACGADTCAAAACPANACGANACAADLGLLPCPAEACAAHLGIPFCPFIL